MVATFFTFGSGQPGYPGYVKILAVDRNRAREIMFENYPRWGFEYASLEKIHENDRILREELVD